MRLTETIVNIRQETPTIKSFVLDLDGKDIGFRAGQWLDLFVTLEGAEAVGGYSITSSPADQNSIELAVRWDGGDHAVTGWLHTEALVGDPVEISLGGDFHYTPDEADSIVLIGGGIGLTPLMSIVRSADELAERTNLTLIYSASTPDELLFRGRIERIAKRNSRIRCVFTVTRPPAHTWTGRTGRIDADLLRTEAIDLGALFFVCGPPDMIRSMIDMLCGLGVPLARIRYEQWW